MAKINFTKEHYVKMSGLAFAMLVNNETISSKMGQPLNIVELMHTTTVQTLNDMRLNIGKQIEKLESQDEWVSTDNTQERLEKLKKQKELLNLLIGWKRKKLEIEEAQYKKRTLTEQLNKLKEEQKTPEDKIKELEEQLAGLDITVGSIPTLASILADWRNGLRNSLQMNHKESSYTWGSSEMVIYSIILLLTISQQNSRQTRKIWVFEIGSSSLPSPTT